MIMECMFDHTSAFNQPIGDWDVSGVTSMTCMFYGKHLASSGTASDGHRHCAEPACDVPALEKLTLGGQRFGWTWCASIIITSQTGSFTRRASAVSSALCIRCDYLGLYSGGGTKVSGLCGASSSTTSFRSFAQAHGRRINKSASRTLQCSFGSIWGSQKRGRQKIII